MLVIQALPKASKLPIFIMGRDGCMNRVPSHIVVPVLAVLLLALSGCGTNSAKSSATPAVPVTTPDPVNPTPAPTNPTSGTTPAPVTTPVDVLTWRNDAARTGQNLNEKVLTPSNVNASTFGKKFTFTVDDYIYTQPLVVTNQSIAGGTHNVVYVATANDSVYAFDADGATTTPYWHDTLMDAANGITAVPGANVGSGNRTGITGTPVIDRTRNAMYVVSRVVNANGDPAAISSYNQYIHALDLSTGAEHTGQPVEISVCVPGTGYDASGGQVCFNPWRENNRVSLALVNNVVYAGWASINDDEDPYHGWILGYDADTLKLVAAFNSTPNGSEGGIWMAGAAPACDSNDNLYVVSGNGTFDSSGSNYGQSTLRLSYATGALTLADFFTPSNWSAMDASDLDVGSGGVLLLPDNTSSYPHQMVFSGKEGNIFLLDRDDMGQFQSLGNSQIVQQIAGAFPAGIFSTPAFWNEQLYFVGNGDVIKQYSWTNGLISPMPVAVGVSQYSFPGASPAISANGTANAIVWTIERTSSNQAVLHAYDATNVANELYNSTQNATRDDAGLAVKFTVPTIANGKAYIGTIYRLEVYGLF